MVSRTLVAEGKKGVETAIGCEVIERDRAALRGDPPPPTTPALRAHPPPFSPPNFQRLRPPGYTHRSLSCLLCSPRELAFHSRVSTAARAIESHNNSLVPLPRLPQSAS